MQLLATVNLLNAGHQRFGYLLPCQEVCNCIYHSNFMLVLDCLHNNLNEIFPLYCENFMKDTVCDIENRQSMTSNHVLCKDKLICVFMTYHQQLLGKQQHWSIREKNKSRTLNDVLTLQIKFPSFKLHFYIKKNVIKSM